MIHQRIVPITGSLDDALAEIQRLLPKRAKLERTKVRKGDLFQLHRPHLPDLAGYQVIDDEVSVEDLSLTTATLELLRERWFDQVPVLRRSCSVEFRQGPLVGLTFGRYLRPDGDKLSIGVSTDWEPKRRAQAFAQALAMAGLDAVVRIVPSDNSQGFQLVSDQLDLPQQGEPYWVEFGRLTDIERHLERLATHGDAGVGSRGLTLALKDYAQLHATHGQRTGQDWGVDILAAALADGATRAPTQLGVFWLPQDVTVEIDHDERGGRLLAYSSVPLDAPVMVDGPVLSGGVGPLDPYIVDWSFVQETWRRTNNPEALILAIRSDERCSALDDERWEPSPKAQVAASDIADSLVGHLEPSLAQQLRAFAQDLWAGSVHDLYPEQPGEPCLGASLAPARVAALVFALGKAERAAITKAFASIEVDEEWWLGSAKDFLSYLGTWLKLLTKAARAKQGVIIVFHG